MKKYFQRLIVMGCICLLSLSIAGCVHDQNIIEQDIRRAINEKEGVTLYYYIIDHYVTSQHPAADYILGKYLFNKNRYIEGELYLKKAWQNKDRLVLEEQEQLALYLAECSINKDEFSQALRFLESVETESSDKDILKAHIMFALGIPDLMYQVLNKVARENPKIMNLDEWIMYASGANYMGNVDKALEIMTDIRKNYGYTPGLGMNEVQLYQSIDKPVEANFSIMREIEYLKGLHGSQFSISPHIIKEAHILLQAYIENNWDLFLQKSADIETEHSFFHYLDLTARIELGLANKEDVLSFVSLRNEYKDFQLFFYRVWKAMDSYQISEMGRMEEYLVRCINSNPETAYAAESRERLASLLGASEVTDMLTIPELEKIPELIYKGAPPYILDPVVSMLYFEDGHYGLNAEYLLIALRHIPSVHNYLIRKKTQAQGFLEKRLTEIIRME